MKNLLLFLTMTLLVQSCAFDPAETIKPVVGRIVLSQMMENVSLLHQYDISPTGISSNGLVDGCRVVTLDTVGNILYVQQDFVPDNPKYHLFKLLDPENPNISLAFHREEVEEVYFFKSLYKCKTCVEYYSIEKDSVLR